MTTYLTDEELRIAAASRPGYATYPQYRRQPERLAPYLRGQPPAPPAVPVPTAAPRWYDHADIWGPQDQPAAAAAPEPTTAPARKAAALLPQLDDRRPCWRPRWSWAVLTASGRVRLGYSWTRSGARRRGDREARRAAR